MTTVQINPFNDNADPASLWQHYSGQQTHQDVFISLDTRDGELTADYNGEVGNAVPAAVWHGQVRRYELDVIPTAAGANRLLARLAPLAQRILDAWDAGDGAAVDAAEDEMRVAVRDIPDRDCIDVWSVDALCYPEVYDDITADMGDDDITAYAADLLRDMASDYGTGGYAVCDGLVEALTEERDSKRAGLTV